MHKKEAEVLDNGNSGSKPLTIEGKHKRGKNVSASIPLADKVPFLFLVIFDCLLENIRCKAVSIHAAVGPN